MPQINGRYFHQFFFRSRGLYLAIAFLLFIIAVFFYPILFQRKILFGSDALQTFYPWRSFVADNIEVQNPLVGDIIDALYPRYVIAREAFRGGRFPAWNPYVASGQPFATLLINFSLYPLNILYYIFPVTQAFGYSAMLRVFIAGFGCYLLGRQLTLHISSSLIVAITFMFSGFQLAWLQWPHTHITIWLPFLLIFGQKLISSGPPRLMISLSLIIFFMLMGAFLPLVAYSFYLLGAYLIWCSISAIKSTNNFSLVFRAWLMIGAAFVIAVMLTIPFLLPMLENSAISNYSVERSQDINAYRNFHLPWQHLITFLIPKYFGDHSDFQFWGHANYIETTAYIGVLPLLLGFIALVRFRQNIYVQFFAIIVFLSTAIVFGLPIIQPIVVQLPVLDISINTRLLAISDFGLAILAGFGFEHLLSVSKKPLLDRKTIICFGTALILVLGLIFGVELSLNYFPSGWNSHMTGIFASPSTVRYTLAYAIQHKIAFPIFQFLWFIGIFSVSAGFIVTVIYGRIDSNFIKVIGLLIVFFDLFVFGVKLNPATEASDPYPVTPALSYIINDPNLFRIAPIGADVLPGNTSQLFGLQTITGHSIIHSRRYTRFLQAIDPSIWDRKSNGTLLVFDQSQTNLDSPLFDLLNVKYFLFKPAFDKQSCGASTQVEQNGQYASEFPVGELIAGRRIGQTFRANANNLFQICVLFATYGRVNRQDIHFYLMDDIDNQNEIYSTTLGAAELTDNAWYTLDVPVIVNSQGREFYFYFESPNSRPGDAITIWAASNNPYKNGVGYENEQPFSDIDLTFAINHKLQNDYTAFRRLDFQELSILENENVLPRASVVHRYRVIEDEAQILETLQSPSFEPGQEVLLEKKPTLKSDKGTTDSASKVEIVSYRPEFVELQADMEKPGFIILNDLFYPGWVALVNGKPVPIYQANYLFRAIPIEEAGSYKVTFMFKPESFYRGLIWGGVGVLLLGVIGVWSKLFLWSFNNK